MTQQNDSFQPPDLDAPADKIDFNAMSVIAPEVLPNVDAVEFLRQFHELRSEGQFAQLTRLCSDAVRRFPSSPTLACLLADAIQCLDSEDGSNTQRAMREYQRAIALDPLFGEPFLQIGLILDIHENPAAGVAFEVGMRLENTIRADKFLAQWKSENGNPVRADEILAGCLEEIDRLRCEIVLQRDSIAKGI